MDAASAVSGPQTGESTLRVRLLGGVDLGLGEQRLAPLESARAESLLAYLLLNRAAPQPRQRIAFLLWPDSTESQALTNLRQVLFNLRHALPDADRFIDVQRRTLQWRSDAPLWLDVAAFEEAVADDRLEEAVQLYRGDLLEGSYDDWVLEQRERLAEAHLHALERLADRFERSGRWADAIRCAESLLRHDQLREETYRLLMRLHALSGDGAKALRVYHVCTATLHRELGIEPSPATREVYEGLLAVEPQADDRVAPSERPPLVGRAGERAELSARWRTASGGSPHLVLVSGEPGIGKTRLVDELRTWCARSGAVTAEARAYAAEGALAYGPVATWLRAGAVADRLGHLAGPDLAELSRLLPEIASRTPHLAMPEALPESEQRQRLFSAIARAIAAAGTPLLLVADDLQWWDAESLRFLHFLLRANPEAGLLVAATARREEIDPGHPASELIAGVQALGCFSEIRLERLNREETTVLAQRAFGRTLSEDEASRLYAESEGNPLFVVEAMRAGDAGAATPKVHGVIAGRLRALSEHARHLVGLAATVGREFTAQVLADAGALDDRELVAALDELWRRGLVRAHGANAYDFSHDRIRDVAYGALSPAQARQHHLRVARALEARPAGELDALSGQIAVHYESAGSVFEAITWHARAADVSHRLHANADAVGSLERALLLAGTLPASDERDKLELRLLTALPAPLVALEGYWSPRVGEIHAQAVALAAAVGVEPEPPLVRSLALSYLTRGDFETAQRVGQQLRARAERDGDDVLLVESAYVLGVAAFWRGRLEEARCHFAEAVERYRPEHRRRHLVQYGQDPQVFCMVRLAYTLWLLGREEEAARALETALGLAEQTGHPYTRTAATLWAAYLALDQQDVHQLRERMRVAAGPSSEWQGVFAHGTLESYLDAVDGRAEEGVRRAQQWVSEVDQKPSAPGLPGMAARILVETCAAAGDAPAGLTAVDEALRRGAGADLWEAEFRRLRARFLSALGAEIGEVEAELGRALEVAQRQGALQFERRAREDLERVRSGAL